MKSKQQRIFVLLLFLISWFALSQIHMAAAQEGHNAQQAVEAIWERAQTSGAYEFRTLIQQTIYPAPSIRNAGKQPQIDKVGLEGAINTYAESFTMTFWRNATFDPAQGIEMKVENGRTYARTGLSEWEEVDGISEAFAPAGDPLNFLAGVNKVVQGEDALFALGGIEQTFTTYHFELDGSELAAYLRRVLEAQLRQQGDLPLGMQLGELEHYRQLAGSGELWVTAAGLPARLSLDLDMGQTENGEKISSVITTELFNFDTTLLETSLFTAPQTWLNARLPTTAVQQEARINLSLFLFFGLVALILTIHWQKRWVYKLVTGFIILSLVATPLLNGEIAQAHDQRMQADQARQEENQRRQEMYEQGHEALKNEWDPHLNPFNKEQQSKIVNRQSSITNASPTLLASTTITDTDSDGDGLFDDAEEFWGTCAYSLTDPEYATSEACEGIADPTDSDGDGLGDGTEANELFTYPDDADTDGDTLTDTLEVEGFFYNGQQWYLDPTESDTNSDGLSDGQECSVWYSLSDDFDPNAICPDTDNDGTPDLFDDDNDDDGLLDIDDLDPEAKGAEVYSEDNPLEVAIDGLQTDKPVLVELQFRPTVTEHLAYSGLILDWPSGDTEGQIQRVLTTTFATTENEDAYSTSDDADYGDIKIFPLLEIYIPYSQGHYGNLPVQSSLAGISRTLDLTVSQWLDSTELDPYSITVIDADEGSGDLVAYVPLATVTSNAGDENVAFSAQMIYYPSQGSNGIVNWGSHHEYRINWAIQMITDSCIDDEDDPDTCEREDSLNIIHSYEEAWEMTGFSVSEEHGYDIALLYEDPNENQGQYAKADPDLDYDDLLWLYAWNLSNTFATGLDCDTIVDDACVGDGERDVTLDNLQSTLEAWSTISGTVENYAEMVTHAYRHTGYAAVVAMTDTVDILNSKFITYTDETKPSILMVDETVNRSVGLNNLDTITAGPLTFDLTDELTATLASLTIATYQYDNDTSSWESVDDEDYLEYLTTILEDVDYFQAEDETDESIEEAQGKLMWAQSYYTTLANGISSYVDFGGEAFYSPDEEDTDYDSESVWTISVNTSLILSNGLVAKRLAASYALAIWSRIKGAKFYVKSRSVWYAIRTRYTLRHYNVTSQSTTMFGKTRTATQNLSQYLPDDSLLTKITKQMSIKIIKVTMVLFLVGAIISLASLFITDTTTANIVNFVG